MIKATLFWFCNLRKIECFIIILFTSLILSPLGSNLFLVFSGYYLPEVAVVGLFYLAYLNIYLFRVACNKLLKNILFYFILIAILFLFTLGTLQHGNFIAAYSGARSLAFLFLGWWLVTFLTKHVNLDTRIYFLLTIVVLSTIFSILYFIFFSNGVKAPYSIPLILLLGLLIASLDDLKLVFLGLLAIIFMVIGSSYRAYWFYGFMIYLGVLTPYIMGVTFKKNGFTHIRARKLKVGLSIVILSSFTYIFAFEVIYDWLESDPKRYHQTIYKFEQLHDSLVYGDDVGISENDRMEQAEYLFSNWFDFILPSGFYDRADRYFGSLWSDSFTLAGGGSPVNDGVYLYMAMTFGFLITLIILLFLLYKLVRNFFLAPRLLKPVLISIYVSLLLVFTGQGAVMLVISQSFYLGLLLSILINKSDYLFLINDYRKGYES